MDFNRSSQGSQAGPVRPTGTPAASTPPAPQKPGVSPVSKLNFSQSHSKLHRWSFIALLLSGTILFIAMIFFIVFGTPVNREAKFINDDQYQAVFVNVNGTNGGQVYFGKVTSLTSQFIRLSNVFYIQNQASADGQSAAASYNLVKLGCELHGPTDEMLINRQQVFFWENLKADGQVSQKIAEFKKQNPNGQKCEANTGSTQQSGGTTQQSGTGQSTGTGTATPTPTPATGTTRNP